MVILGALANVSIVESDNLEALRSQTKAKIIRPKYSLASYPHYQYERLALAKALIGQIMAVYLRNCHSFNRMAPRRPDVNHKITVKST